MYLVVTGWVYLSVMYLSVTCDCLVQLGLDSSAKAETPELTEEDEEEKKEEKEEKEEKEGEDKGNDSEEAAAEGEERKDEL